MLGRWSAAEQALGFGDTYRFKCSTQLSIFTWRREEVVLPPNNVDGEGARCRFAGLGDETKASKLIIENMMSSSGTIHPSTPSINMCLLPEY